VFSFGVGETNTVKHDGHSRYLKSSPLNKVLYGKVTDLEVELHIGQRPILENFTTPKPLTTF
jgi:hypothetical protein